MVLLSSFFVKLKPSLLFILGIIFIASGIYFRMFVKTDEISALIVFGILPKNGISTADYVPLIPNFGVFLFGIAAGKIIYKNKRSIFKNEIKSPFLSFLGRNTFAFYFIHQIILFIILSIAIFFK